MAEVFQLEIVTPEKRVVDKAATEAQIPGKNGYLGVLPGHAPLITELAVGEITFRSDSGEQRLAVASGFAEVLPDKVPVLRKAKERAEQWLAGAQTEVEVERALDALHRAEVRLRVAGKS